VDGSCVQSCASYFPLQSELSMSRTRFIQYLDLNERSAGLFSVGGRIPKRRCGLNVASHSIETNDSCEGAITVRKNHLLMGTGGSVAVSRSSEGDGLGLSDSRSFVAYV